LPTARQTSATNSSRSHKPFVWLPLFPNLHNTTLPPARHTAAVQRLFDKTLSPTSSIIPAPSPRLTPAAPAERVSAVCRFLPGSWLAGSRGGPEGGACGREETLSACTSHFLVLVAYSCFSPPLRTPADLYCFLTASRPSTPPCATAPSQRRPCARSRGRQTALAPSLVSSQHGKMRRDHRVLESMNTTHAHSSRTYGRCACSHFHQTAGLTGVRCSTASATDMPRDSKCFRVFWLKTPLCSPRSFSSKRSSPRTACTLPLHVLMVPTPPG
jgi:hypothetical protein